MVCGDAALERLERMGLSVDDLAVIELNEAFASEARACGREPDLASDRVNPTGGAIALGHPLGCTGARLLVSLGWELRRDRAIGSRRCHRRR